MKKIAILHGRENTFPQAFIDEVNRIAPKTISAEPVKIEMVEQGAPTDYAVIIDRISQDVPFYRAFLKNASVYSGIRRCSRAWSAISRMRVKSI